MRNNGWSANVRWVFPEGMFLHPAVFDRLTESLAARGVVYSVYAQRPQLGMTFSVDALSHYVAKDVAMQVADDALARAGLPAGKLSVERVTSHAQLDAEIEKLLTADLPSAKVLPFSRH